MLDLPMNGLSGIMPYWVAEGRMPLRAAPRFLLVVHKYLTILPRERSIFLFEFPHSKALAISVDSQQSSYMTHNPY